MHVKTPRVPPTPGPGARNIHSRDVSTIWLQHDWMFPELVLLSLLSYHGTIATVVQVRVRRVEAVVIGCGANGMAV